MKAAIYARFSTELQSERSIDDQVALCRAYCERHELLVAEVFDDRARSGASVHGRQGLATLLRRAKAGAFDVVVVEALDRLSRDQEELAGVWKRLRFDGVEIQAVHDGVADAVQIGVRGLVGALFLQDLAHKVHRGMAGVVRDGRHPGGQAYGYRAVPGKPGELVIHDAEANIVRRIFAEYIDGATPRQIAAGLNRDGVPSPRGSKWNASTINGSRQRSSGILNNALYAGEFVWNRVHMIKNPDTGRRVSRVNAADQRQSTPMPHLRIVEQDVVVAARDLRRARGAARPEYARGPKRLLSGLLRCGVCGGGMALNGSADRSGKRIRCTTATESGSCSHGRRYYVEKIEKATLEALREQLRHPELLKRFVQEYHAERQRLAAVSSKGRSDLQRELADVRARLDRMVEAIASGLTQATTIREKLLDLEARRTQLEAKLAEPVDTGTAITLHPAALSRYLADIDTLHTHLASGDAKASAKHLRTLVKSVIVHPVAPGEPMDIEITGYLASLLHAPQMPPNGSYRAVARNDGSGGQS
jgi:site-specific DNA recombinase